MPLERFLRRQFGLLWVWFGFSTTVMTDNVVVVEVEVIGVAVFATTIAWTCM